MDYKKKYEKANNVLTKIQKMIDDHELDATEFCGEVCHLLREYNNNK
jgi:hypothetical protein